eukprot:gene17170-biopygen13209
MAAKWRQSLAAKSVMAAKRHGGKAAAKRTLFPAKRPHRSSHGTSARLPGTGPHLLGAKPRRRRPREAGRRGWGAPTPFRFKRQESVVNRQLKLDTQLQHRVESWFFMNGVMAGTGCHLDNKPCRRGAKAIANGGGGRRRTGACPSTCRKAGNAGPTRGEEIGPSADFLAASAGAWPLQGRVGPCFARTPRPPHAHFTLPPTTTTPLTTTTTPLSSWQAGGAEGAARRGCQAAERHAAAAERSL